MGRLYACNFYVDEKSVQDSFVPLIDLNDSPEQLQQRRSTLPKEILNKNMLLRSLLDSAELKKGFFKGPYISTRKSIIRPASSITKQVFKDSPLTWSSLNDNSNSTYFKEPEPEYPSHLIIPDYDTCIAMGGMWKSYPFNFDNVINAFLTLFQVASAEGWVDTFYATLDSFVFFPFWNFLEKNFSFLKFLYFFRYW